MAKVVSVRSRRSVRGIQAPAVRLTANERRPVAGRKRLNIEFPDHVASQLDVYAEVTGRTKTEFLRLAVGTYAILCDELMQGNRVFITTPDAKQNLRELVFPA